MTDRYIYDPHRRLLMAFRGKTMIGGYLGDFAEIKFEELLFTDVVIELGQFMTPKERREKEIINQSNQKR